MAKFVGMPGQFQKERALRLRQNALIALFIAGAVVYFVFGYAAARHNLFWAVAALVLLIPYYFLASRGTDRALRRIHADETGASGETEVAEHLRALPDTYTVVHDLDFFDSYGNIDHLVLGPTGIFAIDTKNWRGTVKSDGQGELLCNGKPTDKPHVRYFTRRVMEFKDRIKALTKLDPYVQAVFVFPRAYVEANWGTTGAVHCIRAEQLADYVIKFRPQNPPTSAEISRLVAAVSALKNAIAEQHHEAEESS